MNNLKLGIFGDSFASLFCRNHKRYATHPIMKNLGKPWPLLLNNYDVTNYAASGSDLYFSYKLYKENKHKHEKNIFVITAPYRLSVNNQITKEIVHLHHSSIANSIKDRSTGYEKELMDAVLKYYEYVIDYEKDLLFHNLMIEELKKENVLLIHGFGEKGLINVFDMESSVWGLTLNFQRGEKFKDFRYCHLTKENNEILAQIITDCLKNNKPFEFDLKKFYKPLKSEKDKYVIKTYIIEKWLKNNHT
jgi:hypothetical protein